jgi:membrane associated rhomboid family serine protease
MIPVRDVMPARTTPVVAIGLMAASVLVFVGQAAVSPDDLSREAFFYSWGLTPAAFSWSDALTALFVHAGWLHLGSNMLALWIFGENVEDRLGHGRFLAFYLLAGLAAALAHAQIGAAPSLPLIGSTGAAAGVIGAYVALFPRSRVLLAVPLPLVTWEAIEMPAPFVMGVWFLLQISGGLSTPVDIPFWSIAGGFAAGLATVWIFRRPERQRIEWWAPD